MVRASVLSLMAGALISFSVSAQWVKLDLCGFVESDSAFGDPVGPAPNIGPTWVWVPYVVSVTTIKKGKDHVVECSMVTYTHGRVIVIGSGEEIHRRLVGQ